MRHLFTFTVLFALFASQTVYGAALTWNGSTTAKADWNTASNWTPAQVPTSTDSLTLSPTGGKYTGNITLATGGTLTIQEANDSTCNYFTNFYNDFTMTGGTVNFDCKRVLAGIGGTDCTWDISGGTFNYTHNVGSKNGTFRFGTTWTSDVGGITPTETPTKASSQTLNISGSGTQFNAARLALGYVGGALNYTQTVRMNVSGGATVTLGASAGGEYSYIGRGNANMDAALTISDSSTFTGGGKFIVGWDYGKGTITLEDTSKFTLTAGDLSVGSSSNQANKITVGGTSTLEIKNGGINLGSANVDANTGVKTNGTGTLEVSGGTAKASWMSVSATASNSKGSTNGTGTVNVTSGTLNIAGNLNVYKGGTLTISGGTDSSIGTLNVYDGGTATFSGGSTNVATFALKAGSVTNITDSAQITYTTFYQNAAGTLNVNLGETGSIGTFPHTYGITNLNGGKVSTTGDYYIRTNDGTTEGAILTVNGGELNVGSQIQLAFGKDNLKGKLIVNGGSVTAQYLQIANYTSSSGDVEINGGTVSTYQGVRIGRNGTGTLTMTGGTLKVGTAGNAEKALILAYEGTGSSGTLTMSGGTIDTTSQTESSIIIGRQGTGTATISQAEGKTTLIKTSSVYLGNAAGASGSWTQSGGTLRTYNLYVGNGGTGEFELTGGELKSQVDGSGLNLNIGNNGTGTFTQTGGTVTATDTNVGVNKTGSLTISGKDTSFTSTNITLGLNAGSAGTLSVSDSATLKFPEGSLQVGRTGNGTVTFKDVTVSGKNIYLGSHTEGTSGTGTLTAENSTITLDQDLYVGTIGGGEATLKNCTTSTKYFCMGWNANASKAVGTITGGTLAVSANMRVGLNAPATLNVGGDASITATNLYLTADSKINFIMQNGQFPTITATGTKDLQGTMSADFGDGLLFVSTDKWTITTPVSTKIENSDYFTVSNDSGKLIATLRTDGMLPTDSSSQGLVELTSTPTELAFYTGLWNYDTRLGDFVAWLNSTNDSLNAKILDALLGSISVTVPSGSTAMLWDFTNSGTGAIYSTTPAIPEPSTWVMLVIGVLMLKFYRKRNCRQ